VKAKMNNLYKIIKIKPETKWSMYGQKQLRSNSSMLQNTETTCT